MPLRVDVARAAHQSSTCPRVENFEGEEQVFAVPDVPPSDPMAIEETAADDRLHPAQVHAPTRNAVSKNAFRRERDEGIVAKRERLSYQPTIGVVEKQVVGDEVEIPLFSEVDQPVQPPGRHGVIGIEDGDPASASSRKAAGPRSAGAGVFIQAEEVYARVLRRKLACDSGSIIGRCIVNDNYLDLPRVIELA